MSGMKENIETSFLDSMERVLKDHDPTCIRKLSLVARCMGISSSRINSWVSLALSREVQELHLDISSETPFVWPNGLFTAESLRILKLRIYSIFNVPSFVHFSNLKTLHLRELAFPVDESTNQFFAGCTVLQELVLLNCAWKHSKRVTLSIPTLREFKFLEDSYYSDYNLVLDCVVMIYAENLMSLDVKGYLTVEVSLCNLASLVNARINVLDCGMEKDNGTQRAFKLINGIRNVKSLALSGVTIEVNHHFLNNYLLNLLLFIMFNSLI
ncbi:F-box/LRR-repeat protein At4g14096-like [Pistacia vera]|uniref:F-box/LRR-repeat protein At4g14096-like n=1 Tax=Pistacia vera TaxID=55513 RepID=UPI001263A9D7|nr:F-box/LRR-repeat protein At4g14096-like [Pistacia vera]